VADLWVQTSWRRLRQRTTKVAFSITELTALTSDFSTKYAPGCTAYTIRTDPATFLLVYNVKCTKKDKDGKMVSNPKGWEVRIKFDPSKIDDKSTVDNLDVQLNCKCPAFLWWGAQWNLGEGDALYNKNKPQPLYKAPTDPSRFQNVICKHVKVVSDKLGPLVEKIIAKYRDAAAQKKHEEDLQQIETEKIVQEQETEEAEKKEPAKKSPGGGGAPAKKPAPSPVQDKTKKEPEPEPEEDKTLKTKPAPAPKKEEPKEPETKPEKKSPVKEIIKKKEPKEEKVAPNITVFDDDDGDEIIKINRLLQALPLAHSE